jgi:hypothetical protein
MSVRFCTAKALRRPSQVFTIEEDIEYELDFTDPS